MPDLRWRFLTAVLSPLLKHPLRSPTDPSSLLIKRLVALPKTLVRTLPPHPESTVRVPPGHCWIEGDERFHTRDSNTFGPVPLGLIESKVEYIVWPPRSVRSLCRPGAKPRRVRTIPSAGGFGRHIGESADNKTKSPYSRWGRVAKRPGWEKRVTRPRKDFFA